MVYAIYSYCNFGHISFANLLKGQSMSNFVKQENQNQQVLESVNANSVSFNFDLWAREVKRQMLEALNKKTTH